MGVWRCVRVCVEVCWVLNYDFKIILSTPHTLTYTHPRTTHTHAPPHTTLHSPTHSSSPPTRTYTPTQHTPTHSPSLPTHNSLTLFPNSQLFGNVSPIVSCAMSHCQQESKWVADLPSPHSSQVFYECVQMHQLHQGSRFVFCTLYIHNPWFHFLFYGDSFQQFEFICPRKIFRRSSCCLHQATSTKFLSSYLLILLLVARSRIID